MKKNTYLNQLLTSLINMLLFFSILLLTNTLKVQAEGTREILVNTTTYAAGGTTFQQFDTTKTVFTGTAITTPANLFQIWDNGPSAGGVGRISGTYNTINPAFDLYRIKIRVNVGDVINIGFQPYNNETSYWRLYNANNLSVRFNNPAISTNLNALGIETAGTDIMGNACYSYLVPKSTTATQPGYIRYYSQTAVGPAPSCSTVVAGGLGRNYPAGTYCGYTSIKYIVQASDIPGGSCGDFFIVMNRNMANTVQNVKGMYTMFDVTVWEPTGAPINLATVTPADFVVRKARMFSAAWDINCNGTSSPRQTFNSRLYFYSKDSVVTSVTFNQMRPFGFVISANSTGTSNTGNTDFDRRSRIQFHGAPEYPIFLNNPYPTSVADRTCGITPKTSFGNVVGDVTITGCDNDRCINIMVDKTGTVGITLMDATGSFVPRVFDNTTLTANQMTCIPWDGKDGAGNQIIGPVTVQVNYFNGLTNLPLFDVEYHDFGYIIDLIAPTPSVGADPILVFWDDRPGAGTGTTDINAGQALDGLWDSDNNPLTADVIVGYHDGDPVNGFQAHSTYNLLGCDPTLDHSAITAGRQGCHLWSNRGLNITCPTNGTQNCAETINTWWNANVIKKTASYVPSNVKAFADPGAVPTNADGTGGSVAAKTKNYCSTVNPIPIEGVIKIDINLTSQADAINVLDDINGTGTWSLIPGFASGSLGSAASNLVNTYIPVNADYTRGYVLLKVTSDSTSQTPCGRAHDTLRINLFRGPEVWVRPNQTTCFGNSLVSLDPGIVGDSSGVNNVTTSFIWKPFSGATPLVGGIFVPNNQSLGALATYTPPASFASGVITMRLVSVNTTVPAAAVCPADSAEFTITVNPLPSVDAGSTLSICNLGVGLSPVTIPANHASTTAGVGSTFQWLSLGGGSFTGASNTISSAVTYNPTAAELATGSAKLILSVTQPTPACAPIFDTLTINFTSRPTADAGPDLSRCKNNITAINLNGSATGFSSVGWSFTPVIATGNFSAPTSLATTFTPTGTLSNSYTITLTVNSATCPSVTDQMILTLTDSATVEAGNPIEFCPENPTVQLNATLSAGFTGQWFLDKDGTQIPAGTFIPNSTDPNAQYTLTDIEKSLLGFGLFYVTSTVGNTCNKQADGVGISPITVPTIAVSDQTMCANGTSISLSATVGAGSFASYTWSSLGSSQAFTPITSTIPPFNTTFTPNATDKANGSVKIVFSLQPIIATCNPVKDTMTLTFTDAPIAIAGPNQSVCSNNAIANISGTTSPASATHLWSFVSGVAGNIGSPGNLATTFTATGTPAAGSSTVLRLTSTLAGCNNVTSDITINYTAAPTVNVATAPGSVCKNNPIITLSGTSSTGALHWTSSSGCASCFSDTNAVSPTTTTYTPTATDLSNGSVSFTINSRNNGNCAVVNSSTVQFTFIESPTVNLNTYPAVCENNATISLTESISSLTGATGGTWTSSSGCSSCFGNVNALTTTYTPSATDIANGTVTFTLTTTGNTSNCISAQDNTTVTINKAPAVVAGPDLTVCSNQNTITLNGATQTNTTGVTWSVKAGAGTGSITNPSLLNGAVYNITATDKINGTAIVILTGTGNTGCASVSQERVIQFTDIPTANAGPDKTICQNDAPATLDGSGSSGGTWTCAGCLAGITNAGNLTASYSPAPGDINQTRAFTYTIPASGGCPSVNATTNITFRPAPTVNTGGPYTLCGNISTINISGSVTGATQAIWTRSGTGSFGNATNLITTYVPSAADTSGSGIINLTLTTTDGGPCSNVSATTTLTITKPIVISAGPNQNKCGQVGDIISLSGTLTGPATFNTWSIVGASSGVLNNATSLAGATYTVGAGDIGSTVTFRATSNASGACVAQTDDVTHTFTVAPVVTAAATTATICQNGTITLNGTITNTNTGTWACTNCTGTGTFSPDNTHNNLLPQTSVQFSPAPADTSKASLTFQLTSDNVNVCGAIASNTVAVNLEKAPIVFAGNDITLCANKNVYTLSGAISNAVSGVWRAGASKITGFNPSNAFPAATSYDPDTTDVQNGFVTLTLFSTGSVACPSDSDKVLITFSESPIANAGLDRTICKNNPTFSLNGTINPASGFNASWSSQFCGTPCFSSPNSLSTDYTLNAADTTGNTSIQLYLSAVDPSGLCANDIDTVVVNLTQPPIVNITSNFPNPICTDSLYVSLTGTVSSGGHNWTSTGTGNFQANAFQPNVSYPFTAADRAKANLASPNNIITIYLSSDNGFCAPVTDSVKITLTPAPIVTISTGDSITLCANQNTLDLAASVNQAGFEIDWTTSGSGIFSPDAPASANSTTYTISPLDKAAGAIILVAHTINPVGNTCLSATDQYKLTITPIPVVDAGSDVTTCQTVTSIDLSDASSINATTKSVWTTTGTGVFGITNQTVGAGSVYYPSYLPPGPNDVDQASITLTLTGYGCDTVASTKIINFTPKPSVGTLADLTVCNEVNSVNVTGVPTNASSVSWKVSGSATTFANTAVATYNISAADKTTGFVDLVFTVNGNGDCSPVRDTMRITIRPQPTINIGNDVNYCSKTSSEVLAYNFLTITMTNGITPTWTTTGTPANLDTFNPLAPTYTVSNADINNGSVTISASTRSAAGCMVVSDAMVINIEKAPTIDLGPNLSLCELVTTTTTITATTTNSGSIPSWSSDGTGFYTDPNPVSGTAEYNFDVIGGENAAPNNTWLYAFINGRGSCPSATDSVNISFTNTPILTDLVDTVICYRAGVPINYAVSSGVSGTWASTDVTGTFNPAVGTPQSVVYTTSTNTDFTITFTPTDICYAGQTASAFIDLVENPTVTVPAASDICNNNFGAPIALNAIQTNGVSFQWTTIQGFGTLGSSTSIPANYTLNPDSSDFGLDSLMFRILVTSSSPVCTAEATLVVITHKAPIVSSSNQTVCADILNDANAVTLNGSISNGFSAINWSGTNLTIASPTNINSTATVTAFPATATLSATGLHASCAAVSTNITINQQVTPTFSVVGTDIQSCSNGNSVNLNLAAISPMVNGAPNTVGGQWSTLGSGTFSPNAIGSTNITYNPSTADTATSLLVPVANVDLIYTITDTGVCYKGYADTINVVFNKPISIAANNPVQTFCAQDNNVVLTANTTPTNYAAGPTILWSIENGLGNLTQSPAPGALTASYDPNPSDIPNGGDVANGGAILMVKIDNVVGCPADSDYVSLILVPEPAAIVNAGSTLLTCKDNSSVSLQGLVINADGGIWRTSKYPNLSVAAVAATGTFSDSTDLEATYFFTSADTAKSSVRLYLYSAGGNSLCNQVVDSVDINFIELPLPIATVGVTNVCADVDSIGLTGSFTVGGINGVWSSSGDGIFAFTNEFDSSPVYVPGSVDINKGKVVLTYSSLNYQDCGSYSASDSTTIKPKIETDLGPDQTVCANNTVGIPITASLTPAAPASIGAWTILGTSGTDYDGTSSINGSGTQLTYIPGPSIDPTVGAVSIKFVGTDATPASPTSIPCKADSALMVLEIAPAPTVTIASNTQTVCNDVTSIDVHVSSMSVATGGFWTTTGTGTFADPAAQATTYNFSNADLSLASLDISFVTTGNISNGSQCNAVADAMTITLKQKPTVDIAAVPNCITSTGINLDGSSVTYVDPGVSGVWSTSSSAPFGQFSLDEFITSGATTTSYFPSTSDVANGRVTLTLSSAGAGTCLPVSKSITINVSTTPIADAGDDQFVCSGASVTLAANPQANLVTYQWQDITTPGATATGVSVTETPINGTVNYVLTVTDNKGCTNTDTLTVNAVTNPNITLDEELCYDFYGHVTLSSASPLSPLGDYQWYYNDVLMSNETKDSVRITQPGEYHVVYNLGSCSINSQNTTLVLDLPRILTPNFIGCENSTVSATVTEIPNSQLSGYTSGSLMPYSYTWTPGGLTGNPATLPTSSTSIDTLTYIVTSQFTSDFTTCTYTDSVYVITLPTPDPRLIDTTQVCQGGTVTLDANAAPSNLPTLAPYNPTMTWYEASDASKTSLGNTATLTVNTSGNYVIEVTVGQCIGDDTSNLSVRPFATKTLPTDTVLCFDQLGNADKSITLNAGTSAGTPGLTSTTYNWYTSAGDPSISPNNGQTATVNYNMIKDQEDEEILVFVDINNTYGALSCPTTDTINVRDLCVPRLFPPTVFHPSGGGSGGGGGTGNEIDKFFTIKGKYYTNFKITVYSRWGEVIFYTEDINEHWDGTYRGELMPIGVYAYVITYEGKSEDMKGPFKKEGRIVLVR